MVKSALSRNLPIHEFVSLAKKLFTKMGDGGLIKWDDYTMVMFVFILFSTCRANGTHTQRFTLDAVGRFFHVSV